MHIAILTFDAFNELDSFIALGILNRIQKPDWTVSIASPTPQVTSMNGVTIERHMTISDVRHADAVLVGSGMKTRDVVADAQLIAELQLDPNRQLLGAQCSGTLVLAKLGLLNSVPACTDLTTTPWVQEAGIEVLNQPLFASGNVATAGGCIASQYLAAWLIAKTEGLEAAKTAIHYVAPVGEKETYVSMMLDNITPYL
ncbi:DJ-1/PfpI family protein [Marinomonas sp.]|nr:DJ-1/PfpI family protein [Marinomonas sp.]MDB4837582.1 DJ-1/PfpI family protein [Marinomonas sp.]